jgi:superfamily I DNA and/or RNA helicase
MIVTLCGPSVAKKIGVITPYWNQVTRLRKAFSRYLDTVPGCKPGDIDIDSIENFQGRAKDVIIFNGVRNN